MEAQFLFISGEPVQVSGVYKAPIHTDGSKCLAPEEVSSRHLRAGQTFPEHECCGLSACWFLFAVDDQDEDDW